MQQCPEVFFASERGSQTREQAQSDSSPMWEGRSTELAGWTPHQEKQVMEKKSQSEQWLDYCFALEQKPGLKVQQVVTDH